MSAQFNLTYLNPHQPDEPFPPVELASNVRNGLLAVGGDLSVTRLLNAYRNGIFPWFGDDEPIYWWSPDPRTVLFPTHLHLTRSLRKSIRNKGYRLSIDRAFGEVVRSCAAPRTYSHSTWITDAMQAAYLRLYDTGFAHSFEVWHPQGQLVGGLYGVVTGGVFNGESMFSLEPDTSKIALSALCYALNQWGFRLIDCQMSNPYLMSMGATLMARREYIDWLQTCHITPTQATWQIEFDNLTLSQWQPNTD